MNKEQLDKILKKHKLWLETNGAEGESANLSGANLNYADLRGEDLSGADLHGASLRHADLSGASLRHADLSGASLRHADLSGADLDGADLRYANLHGADLRDAYLGVSAFPLWFGGLDVHIDDKQAKQLLYHFVRNVRFSKNTSEEMKKLCKLKSIVEKANEFHRVDECGRIEE